MPKQIKVRFVVLLPTDINRRVSRLAQRAARLAPHKYVVDGKKFISHITLCRFWCNPDDVKDIASEANKILAKRAALSLRVKDYIVSTKGGLYLKVKPNSQLSSLREEIFRLAQLFNKHPDYTKLKKPYVPHVTMVGFRTEKAASLVKNDMPAFAEDFLTPIVAFTDSDENGQVTKVFKKFRLSASV